MEEVPSCENCSADNVKEWLNSDEMKEITELTIVEMVVFSLQSSLYIITKWINVCTSLSF